MLSVGQIFIRERKRLHYSVEDVEKGTHLRKKFIEAVEADDWDSFESKIYIIGAIKGYAQFLGLDTEKMSAYFRRDYEKQQEEIKFKKSVTAKYFSPDTRKLIIAGLVTVFVIFASYFSYQVYLFLTPPEVTILEPERSVFGSSEEVTVVGQTDTDAVVTILDDEVFQDEEGVFTYDFPLSVGRNELVITVKGANGKVTEVRREFIRERE